MDVNKIIYTVLGIIGLLFILMVVYYFISRWTDQTRRGPSGGKVWPPASYMEQVGLNCPDYWISAGSSGGYHKCVNKFHLPVRKSHSSMCKNFKCFDDGSDTSRSFKTINRWPVRNRNTIKERCKWRDCCGSDKNIPASWVGLEQTCGY